jgi:hypothetical protein
LGKVKVRSLPRAQIRSISPHGVAFGFSGVLDDLLQLSPFVSTCRQNRRDESVMWVLCPTTRRSRGLLLPTFASRYTSRHTTFKLQHLTFGTKALSWYNAESRQKAPLAHCVECHVGRNPRAGFHGNGGREEEGLCVLTRGRKPSHIQHVCTGHGETHLNRLDREMMLLPPVLGLSCKTAQHRT